MPEEKITVSGNAYMPEGCGERVMIQKNSGISIGVAMIGFAALTTVFSNSFTISSIEVTLFLVCGGLCISIGCLGSE